MNDITIGKSDLLMMTFDALRFDVAQQALNEGMTPYLKDLIGGMWEPRHSPGSFTYAAHAAFFAGFWPTPTVPGPHPRPFALRFAGSRSIDKATCLLDGDNIVDGLRRRGYYSICIGGVGYFNKLNPLGLVFPSLFERSEWRPTFAVSEVHSTREQVCAAVTAIHEAPPDRPLFFFVNLSALHSPTHIYVSGERVDSVKTQTVALAYVDQQLPPLFAALQQRGRGGRAYLMSDHGTLFGEDGYTGHRVGHPNVWTIPYAEHTWGPAS